MVIDPVQWRRAPGGSCATLVSVLRAHAAEVPGLPILRVLGDHGAEIVLTYGELDRRARAVAARLQEAGAAGERALVLQEPGADYVAALLGCLYAGVVAVPAYPPRFSRRVTRLVVIVSDARARFALSSAKTVGWLGAAEGGPEALSRLTWITTDGVDDEGAAAAYQPPTLSADGLALLQYTSGSTSDPKGVMLTHRHFLENIAALAERGQVRASDRWVSWLPPYHDMGLVGGVLLPLCLGTETVLMSPLAFLQRPARWLEAISRFRATVSGGPNFGFELCLRRVGAKERAGLDLSCWRTAFCGAERVRPETLEGFSAAFAEVGFQASALVPCYGLAEATLGVSLGAPGRTYEVRELDERALERGCATPVVSSERARRLVGCGAVLPATEVSIVDAHTRVPCEVGTVGEIWVKGPSVAEGYWGRPELSEEVFRARAVGRDGAWLRTGDLGFLAGGELYVTCRLKDLIILRGLNYAPEDLEATVQGCHPAARAGGAVAFAVEVEGEERLVMVLEIDPGAAGSARVIARALRDAIASEHELPVQDVVLVRPGGVPRTTSGKVQRALCRRQYLEHQLEVLGQVGVDEGAAQDAPPALVADVAAVMAELLGVARVDADEDFFWLGGHSLLAAQLVARLSERLGSEVPLRAVFDAPTPRRLAAALHRRPEGPKVTPIPRVDRAGALPLSFSQERMWFLHQLDPAGAAYNVAGAVGIEGPLVEATLAQALEALLARHEILRSNYPTIDGAPALRLAAGRPLPYGTVDLTGEADPRGEAIARASALANAPFDVARESLVRAVLYRTGPERHVLAVSMHHLVTDAWTMGLLLGDLLALYRALEAGRPLPPEPSSIGYVDYAAWQRAELARGGLDEAVAFWRRTLEGVPPLELPTDRPRSSRRGSGGALCPLVLPAELMTALRALGAAHGATPFMVLLAVFDVVLSRHTGQTDLVVGVPVANRRRVAAEGLAGTLVNTLPIRVRLDPTRSFLELLGVVRQAALDAYAHQDLPFEKLVSLLGVERCPGVSPLVQVMFDFQNAPTPLGDAGSLRLEPLALSRGASQFDLSLLVFDAELGQTAGLEYSTALFDAATVERFAAHLLEVLGAVVREPETAVARLPLLSAAERVAVLGCARDTCRDAPPAALLHERFAAQARAAPNAPAVTDAAGTVTYGELLARVEGLAARLRQHGVGPGERVAVLLDRTRELVVALLAVLETGAAYVPLDPRHPPLRVAYVLEHAAPRLVVTQRSLRERVPGAAHAVLEVDDGAPLALPSVAPGGSAMTAGPGRAAYVIYTSGSTGRPKGVEVPVGALANFLRSMAHTPGLTAVDRVLSVTTIAFDIAGLELFLPLVTGASVYLAPSEVVADGRRLSELITRVAPTMLQATPATWRMLLEAGWRGDGKLKVLCGGEALSTELAARLLECGGEVWNMYGPTETTIWSTLHRVRPGEVSVPVGRPIDETPVYVLDEHQSLCPFGVAGELCIGGAGVANGYFRRPELTRERFLPDPFGPPGARLYRTGDLARLRPDGVFEHLGRLDHQIKIRGFRIEPAEIETVLRESPGVKEALVVTREERRDDVRLVAYYVPTAGPAPASELRAVVARRLPEYMIPSAFVALQAMPVSPNGKIDRSRLPAPEAEHAAVSSQALRPRDQLEARLARIWSEVLAVPTPSVRESFFFLGGHSLLAVQLFARIERELGVELPLSTLFLAPTIDELARAIAQREPSQARSFRHLVPIQPRGARRPLFCVHGAGGGVLHLERLGAHLGTDRPFYGFQAAGVDGRTEPHASIEAMTHAYVEELRLVQPRGPYLLSGYCGGGTVALEMAQRLVAEGEEVKLLAMFDTYRPGLDVSQALKDLRRRALAQSGAAYLLGGVGRRLGRVAHSLGEGLEISLHRARGSPVPHELRDAWLTRSFFRAVSRYQPRPYDGKLTLFRASTVHPMLEHVGAELGWTGLARAGIESHAVPGDHETLVEDPNAVVLAAKLARCLEAADG